MGAAVSIASGIKHRLAAVTPLLHTVLNVLFPPRCAACATHVDAAQALCTDCFAQMHFITPPMCPRCGIPYPYAVDAGGECPDCEENPPHFASLRAVWEYDETTRPLITRFKYADKTQYLPGYARLLRQVGAARLREAEAIIPVPLHGKRLRQRKYNQSSLLAHALAKSYGLPVWDKALLRVRHTAPQAGLDRAERQENVRGAFRVNHAFAAKLRNRTVILVDDVVTTGATVDACSHALRQAGVKAIHVLCLARTTKP